MKVKRLWTSQRSVFVIPILLLAGAGLLLLSARSPRSPGSSPPPALVPTAPWQPMPTRAVASPSPAPTPTAAVDPELAQLQQALLSADLDDARRAWVLLQDSDLVNTSELQILGARLALLEGDLDAAGQRALKALELDEGHVASDQARTWSLLGVILNRRGEYTASEQAFAVAHSLDPGLGPDLFDDRWRNAVRTGDTDAMAELAGRYSIDNPEGQLEPYYRAAALLADNQPRLAFGVLRPALTADPDAPALMWYTLGEVYIALNGFSEAATALEVAASKTARGDPSLSLIHMKPLDALNMGLARAYLMTDRCAEAEGIYRRLSASYPDLEPSLTQAVTCQTPTPTPTHWILRLQPTATPTP